jgi:hypothetical protein
MKGRKIKEKGGSAIVMYIQSTSDILPKGKDIRSIVDITKLYDIGLWVKYMRSCLIGSEVEKHSINSTYFNKHNRMVLYGDNRPF